MKEGVGSATVGEGRTVGVGVGVMSHEASRISAASASDHLALRACVLNIMPGFPTLVTKPTLLRLILPGKLFRFTDASEVGANLVFAQRIS